MPTPETFAELLRTTRQESRLKQDDLAHYLEVSQSAVSLWERQDDPVIPWQHIPAMVAMFGWTSDELCVALGWHNPGGLAPDPPPEVVNTWTWAGIEHYRRTRSRERVDVRVQELARELAADIAAKLMRFADGVRADAQREDT